METIIAQLRSMVIAINDLERAFVILAIEGSIVQNARILIIYLEICATQRLYALMIVMGQVYKFLFYPFVLEPLCVVGTCNYNNGTCNCLPHRSGSQCETLLCTIHSPLCEACTKDDCLRCKAGYYLTGNRDDACRTCYDFDPRCAGCTSELGCTTCADSTLTSVRRSGYRSSG